MYWLICHKEIISMLANLAAAIGIVISVFIIWQNKMTIRQMKQAYEADLFFKISSSIDDLAKEQKDIEKKGSEAVTNWWERLFNVLDDFCFIANHKMISKEMMEHYIPTVIDYCNDVENDPEVKARLSEGAEGRFDEIIKIYKRNTGRIFLA